MKGKVKFMGRDPIRKIYDGRSPVRTITLKDVGAALEMKGTSLEDERTNFREASSGNGRGRNLFEKMGLEVEPIMSSEEGGAKKAMGLVKWIALGFAGMAVLCAEPPQVDLSEKARQFGISAVDAVEQAQERKAEIEAKKIEQVKKEMKRIVGEDIAREGDGEMEETESLNPKVEAARRDLIKLLEAEEGINMEEVNGEEQGKEATGKGNGENGGRKIHPFFEEN